MTFKRAFIIGFSASLVSSLTAWGIGDSLTRGWKAVCCAGIGALFGFALDKFLSGVFSS
ncbi:hypothetical protein OIT44_02070 [Weissella ceti]|uniref:Uncharacterized protein n=1 Tax=Weissella ceti TaxID=759620 RepID=A0ABT3E3B8_9LACO|nr:hypothetical protein [Weissella ceti]MCW0952855.1 hypothetical protein [Weissella ceti]QVK12552.1 hypothetical protein KHQ31_02700 [Weissella ceti]